MERWEGFYSGQFWSPNPWGDEDFREGVGQGDNSIPVRNLYDGRPKPDEDHIWFAPDAMSGESLIAESNHEVMQARLDEFEAEHGRDYYQTLHGGGRMMAFHVDRTPDEVVELLDALESYAILDEDNYSSLKQEAEEEAWERWGDADYRRALERKYGGDADFVDDGQLFLHFMLNAEAANEYWEESSDGGVYIDVERVAKHGDTVPVGYVRDELLVNGLER